MSILLTKKYDMVVVSSNDDIVVVEYSPDQPYCWNCAIRKLGALKRLDLDKNAAEQLIRAYRVRAVRIRCDCAPVQQQQRTLA